MSLKSKNPTNTIAWKKLKTHFEAIKNEHMSDWFKTNSKRAIEMSLQWDDFFLDFSKNRINSETLSLLQDLAEEIDLSDAISKYFNGDKINKTEDRAVLHTALRSPKDAKVLYEGVNIIPEISEVKSKINLFSKAVIDGEIKGFTNKSFTDIVNVGIGGSDLGPSMVVDALSYYGNHLKVHFVSNVDGDHVNEVLKTLNPETSLFVIVSKTFTTQETISNATTIKRWFLQKAAPCDVAKQFVAVSTNIKKAKSFGIDTQNIFPMWDWVGGRFSLWSSVGLTISLAVGFEHYEAMLKGAGKMDVHFKETSFEKNIPVLLALIGIWYNNFFKAESEAIVPYTQYLNQFATYLQQASMESNGKATDRNGNKVNYQTGNIIWGEPGTNSQHAFFQLIHQGTKLIPADFIGFSKSLYGNKDHQDKLMSNFFAQTEALLTGNTKEIVGEVSDLSIIPYKIFEGNRPTNTLFIEKLTPESLGKLIAMYEHKIFVQGVIWNIFSYDQFGVELGKNLADKILKEFHEDLDIKHDSSTENLIQRYKSFR
ncbi:MAG: glucose-6-phosphate isomerase [Formosa sp.]|nr:glucose-6-phosphate isomerase [Formosa sp.]|tara:strand:- start:14000 stop:15616 length:1617 start_codon:yes stop_codon:yes gene_type:complete